MMGIFGGKKKEIQVAAYHVSDIDGTVLPVAVPINATTMIQQQQQQSHPQYQSVPMENKQAFLPRTTTTTIFSGGNNLFIRSRYPVTLSICPLCQKHRSRTQTRTYPTCSTWFWVILLTVVFFPLFWIPLCCDSCKRTDHTCKNCGNIIGTIEPMNDLCEKRRG
mmetsp:Transcript_6670/g.7608  ORF Transcript_6670/g.7608 Transcript_6670/m.7608 type:complete len:164 (-) Transcript_6670:65-556(-)